MSRTFGPAYDEAIDGERISKQHDRIRDFMLRVDATQGRWLTLQEIQQALGYPESSISAQLRHFRKPKFGSFRVDKRRRHEDGKGTWEYRVKPPVEMFQLTMEVV